MNNRKTTTTQNELYVAMIGEEDLAKINTLKLRKDSKRNVQVLYGFFLTIANKPFTTANNQVTGRQWFRYAIANKLFATGYDVITKYTGIHKSQISAYVQLLEKLELIHVERTNTIEERTQRANSNSNCNSNSNYKSTDNKSIDNIEINNLKQLTMELTEKISELEEKLMETNHLVEELIVSKAKMESAIISLQCSVDELKNTRSKSPSKSQSLNAGEIGKFWASWNKYKKALKEGETKEDYLQRYKNKASKIFNATEANNVIHQLEEQYMWATSKSQSQSFQIRDEDKVYYNGEQGDKEYLAIIINEMMWKLKYAPTANNYNHNLDDFYWSVVTAKSGIDKEYVRKVWNQTHDSIMS